MFINREKGCTMKKQLRFFSLLGIFLLLAIATSYGNVLTVGPGGTYTTIGNAITAANPGDMVSLLAGNTFTENVTIGKAITLAGVDTTAKIHGSITVTVAFVTIQNLVVYGSTGDGISANGILGSPSLTLTNVVSRNNAGSGTQFTNCGGVVVNTSIFSNNALEGFNTLGGSNYALSGVTANSNGSGSSNGGSGVDIDGVTGTSTLTSTTANNNHRHGVSIGDGSTNITISGGTFTFNGVSGNTQTGGGINIVAEAAKVSNIWVNGPVISDSNMSAGIYIFAATDSITNVTIGSSGSITLAGNGSSTQGAGVSIIGMAKNVNITAQFNQGSIAHAAGLIVTGTDNVGTNSPWGVTVSNSSFTGYTSGTLSRHCLPAAGVTSLSIPLRPQPEILLQASRPAIRWKTLSIISSTLRHSGLLQPMQTIFM